MAQKRVTEVVKRGTTAASILLLSSQLQCSIVAIVCVSIVPTSRSIVAIVYGCSRGGKTKYPCKNPARSIVVFNCRRRSHLTSQSRDRAYVQDYWHPSCLPSQSNTQDSEMSLRYSRILRWIQSLQFPCWRWHSHRLKFSTVVVAETTIY